MILRDINIVPAGLCVGSEIEARHMKQAQYKLSGWLGVTVRYALAVALLLSNSSSLVRIFAWIGC